MGSKIYRFTGTDNAFDWEGAIPKHIPDTDTAKDTVGKVIIGSNDDAPNYVFRYFCVQPGGNSTMPDQHIHDHGMYFVHGKGKVVMNGETFEVKARDMVYVFPNDVHGVINDGDEPLGFLCIIPNKDRLTDYLKLSGKEF